MRISNHILLGLILLCMMAACHHRPAMNFIAIEAIMPTQPDSALELLDTLHTDPNDFSAKDRAHYYLLLTEAMDKCYLTHTTDSLITIAKDYYENANNPDRRAKAWYYMGLIREENQQPLLAQDAYLEALREEERVDDHALLGRINNRLGMLYTWQMVHEKANSYQRKAIEHLKAEGDSSAVQFAYRDLGRNLTMLDSLEQAIGCYQAALSFSVQRRMISVSTELAALYLKTGKHPEARHYLEEANKQAAMKKPAYSLWLVWGEYYMAIRQADSARYYLQRCLDSPHTRPAATHYLAQLADQSGDLAASVHYYKQYDALRDSAYLRKQADLMRTAAADQEHQEIKEKMFSLEIALRDHKIYALCATIIALCGVIAIILFRQRLINNRRKYLLRLRAQVERIEALTRQLRELEETNIEQQLKPGTELLERMRRHEQEKPLTESEWNALFLWINYRQDDFYTRLHQRYPELGEAEIELCCLLRLGFGKNEEIATLCNITSSAVTKRKQRLKQHLHVAGKYQKPGELEAFIQGL